MSSVWSFAFLWCFESLAAGAPTEEGKLAYIVYILSQFGIGRCKIQYFMEHLSRSLESSREQPLHNTVNVWEKIT